MNNYKIKQGSSLILDLIRGVTAQLVVIGHALLYFNVFTFLHKPNFPYIQNIGVLIFFILSGFLISYSTNRKIKNIKNYSFKQFFIDRFSRIYTAFIPAILFVFIIDFISKSISAKEYLFAKAFNIQTFFGNILMLQDHPVELPFKITSFGSARPFWTLSIEWWIYLFFGYFVIVFLKNKLTIKNTIIIIALAIVPFFNTIGGRGNGLFIYWLFGVLILVILDNNYLVNLKKSKKRILIVILTIIAIIKVMRTMEEYEPIFAFLLTIIILLTVDLFKDYNFSKISSKIIRVNASYSYTLYLIHYSILDFLYVHFSNHVNSYLLFFIGLFVSNIISLFLGYYSETILTKKVKMKLYSKFLN